MARRSLQALGRERLAFHAALLALAAGALYWATGPQTSGGDEYIPLAGAMLHGHLWVGPRSWVELVPTADPSRWFVPFPPAPVLFYLPVVAFMGVRDWNAELAVGVMPAMVGGACVGLAYLLLRERLDVTARGALWITAGFATTTLWWVAGMGGTHLMAEVSACFFLLLALFLALGAEAPALAGVFFGLSVASRFPVVMAAPLLFSLYGRRWPGFVVGGAPLAFGLALYNVARFGSPLNNGYALIPSGSGLVTSEPWYRFGLESWRYIPNGLKTMFLSGFSPNASFGGASILLTAPFVLWAVLARSGRALVVGASAVSVLFIDLMHGNPGVAQFGYRFLLDAMPLLLVLLGMSQRNRIPIGFRLAVVFGALFTYWGVWSLAVMS